MVQASATLYPSDKDAGAVKISSLNISAPRSSVCHGAKDNLYYYNRSSSNSSSSTAANSGSGSSSQSSSNQRIADVPSATDSVVVESRRKNSRTTTGQVMLLIRPLLARTATSRQGREHQRFDGACRLVAGCIPVIDGKVVLISSARKQSWILPKGGWEDDETAEQSAIREAYEEAGVVGAVGASLRDVDFSNKHGGPCRLTTYVLYVTEVLETWPESDRSRILVPVEQALTLCSRPEMREAMMEMRDKGLHLLNPTPRPVKGAQALPSSCPSGGNSSE